jgi:Rad3-related DNA helicase
MSKSLDWRPHFPFDKVRDEQARALDFIVDSFYVKQKDYVVAELGTGIGKSAIAVTLGKMSEQFSSSDEIGSAYVLTSQKSLQDQYIKDFSDVVRDIRSSSNFTCSWNSKQSCAETSRIIGLFGEKAHRVIPCAKKDSDCAYKQCKKSFIAACVGITNYSYLLSETVYAGALQPRELVVFDEAHCIENETRKWSSTLIEEKFCNKELKISFGQRENFMWWLENEYAPALKELLEKTSKKLVKAVKKNSVNDVLFLSLAKKNEMLDKHLCQLNRFLLDKTSSKDNYVCVYNDYNKNARECTVKPIEVGEGANKLLYVMGKKKLFLSATVLKKDIFYKSCGLDDSKTDFISIQSPFKSSSYGLTYIPVGSMAKKDIQNTSPKIAKAIKQILQNHKNEKGVIHTVTYNITDEISKIKDQRLLVQKSSNDRDLILKNHFSSKEPTVIVSPAMMEGLDLKDDLGRFQVICKIPFPYIGDEVTKIKMAKSPEWYTWNTVRTLVQTVGRCVRNHQDWTKTYILDECFIDLLKQNSEFFPEFFEDLNVEPLKL